MRSFELVYELKQQTPIIHFQYAQKGATLRATEVKPKLDRYIIERCGGIDKVQLEKSEWLIEGTNALKYRMVIVAPNDEPLKSKAGDLCIAAHDCRDKDEKAEKEKEAKRQINSMYFGNMSPDKELPHRDFKQRVKETYKETVLYKNGSVTVRIICMTKDLRKTINDHIEDFFLMTNFGTRQSKGFGGFTVVKKNETPVAPFTCQRLAARYKELNVTGFYVNKPDAKNVDGLMDIAAKVYAVMKGGLSFKRISGYVMDRYLSDIEDYDSGNEKHFINEIVFPDCDNYAPSEYRFMRAMLGLPNNFTYLKGEHSGQQVNIYSLGDTSFDIERMASPVTIKIVDGEILFLFRQQEQIRDKEFYFVKTQRECNPLSGISEYSDKAAYIRAHGKRICSTSIEWDSFILGFKKYLKSSLGICIEKI